MRLFSLAICLFAFWLALSGHYTPFLLVVGGLCVALCVFVANKMGSADAEGHPINWLRGALSYWPWLVIEIYKSAINVAKIIWHPKLPISPTMTVVPAGQKTPVGIATYANSITLTPGTITTDVSGTNLTVHALEREGAEDLEAGGMNARVVDFEEER